MADKQSSIQTEQVSQLPTEKLWKLLPYTLGVKILGGRWVAYGYLVYILDIIVDAIITARATKTRKWFIIEAPVRHGKSWAIDWILPVWFLEMWPELRILLGGYNEEFATTWGRKVVNQFLSNNLLSAKVHPLKQAASDFEMIQGGGMRCFGINGTVAGLGADLVILDDPVKNIEEANSETMRAKTYDQFFADVFTRLEPGGVGIVMMARRHEDDLIGRIKAQNADASFQIIHLPALAEEDDELGRKPGEALCPARYTREDLLKIKSKVPGAIWNGLFQQRPSAMEGEIFKRANWRYWNKATVPSRFDQQWISCDTAMDEGNKNDYTVIQHWGKRGINYYLLGQVRGQWSPTDQIIHFDLFCEQRPWVTRKLIERYTNGPSVYSALKKKIQGLQLWPDKGHQKESKETLANAVEPLHTAGNIFIPQDQELYPWVKDFIDECANFPNGTHDDQVDTMTMGILYSQGKSGNLALYTSKNVESNLKRLLASQ